jgi:hypothetical protein
MVALATALTAPFLVKKALLITHITIILTIIEIRN